MHTIPNQYFLPENTDVHEIINCFSTLGKLQRDPDVRIQRTYFDTFDWRLYSADRVLVEERLPYATYLRLRELVGNSVLFQLMLAAPRFACELPVGPLRDTIEPLIEMRALLPMAVLDLHTVCAAVLDKQRKTILRVSFEQGHIHQQGQENAPLLPRLRLEPVKGYRKPLRQALTIIEEQLHFAPAGHLLDEALDRIGREAEDYSGKLAVDLQPEMPTGTAVLKILRQLVETMERNLEGTRADLDSEFLHDFRVAVRRTRSLFSQVKGGLPPVTLRWFHTDFKWLGQITGPTRDLDVYLLKLPGYRDSLPQSMQADLAPLHDYLQRHQKREQRKLAKQLNSERFRKLMTDWKQFLARDFDPDTWPEQACQPVAQTANNRIWKRYRMVIKEGSAVTEASPAEALHELRISCKKLRYLMEFFQSLYPEKKIRKQIKALKSLQDLLGDFHDLEVQAEALRRFGHDMQAEQSDLSSETFMAMGVLIDALNQRQEQERRRFAERFAGFARPNNRRVCKELFYPSSGN